MPSCRGTTAKGHRCRLPASRATARGSSELLNRCRHHIEQLDDFLGSPVEGQKGQVEPTQTPHRHISQSSGLTGSTQTSANVGSVRPASRPTSRRRAAAVSPSTTACSSHPSPPTPQGRPAAPHQPPSTSLFSEVDLIPSTPGHSSSSPPPRSVRPGRALPPVTDALAARQKPAQYSAVPSQGEPTAPLSPPSSEIIMYLDFQSSTQTYQRTVALRSIESDHGYISDADRTRRHGSAPPDVSRGFCRKTINAPLPRYTTRADQRISKGWSWWESVCQVL